MNEQVNPWDEYAAEYGRWLEQRAVERPELVNDAVRQVVAAVRDPSTWATPTASPATTPGS